MKAATLLPKSGYHSELCSRIFFHVGYYTCEPVHRPWLKVELQPILLLHFSVRQEKIKGDSSYARQSQILFQCTAVLRTSDQEALLVIEISFNCIGTCPSCHKCNPDLQTQTSWMTSGKWRKPMHPFTSFTYNESLCQPQTCNPPSFQQLDCK